jgi:hypothetical protein
MAESHAAPQQRHLFIDLYRTAVILLMLEGHVVRTFLAPPLQQVRLFQIHEFFHGLSAPAFLFGAGLTFVISTRKRWSEYHQWSPALTRRIRRFLLILSLGLILHLPFFSIRKIILDATIQDYLQLFQCDVLACIGIGLLSLHLLVFLFRNQKLFFGLVFIIIVVVCFGTPLVWDRDALQILPLPFAQLINGNHGSPFPLFPYVGFLFAGVVVSWEYLHALRHGEQQLFMLKVAVLGAGLIALGMIFDALPLYLYPTYNFWYTSPNYFLIRVGALLLAVSAFWYIARKVFRPNSALTVFGRESLFVYVLHLGVLYGTAMNSTLNLRSILGDNHSAGETMEILFLFVAGMFLLTVTWNYLKRKHFAVYRILQLAVGGVFLYFFFTRDF